MPAELVAALRRARQAERRAFTRRQLGDAVRATAALVHDAHTQGWLYSELAPVLGISESTVRQRASRVEDRDAPQPANDEWLTVSDASRFAGVSPGLLNQWYRAGLLPRTQRRGKVRLLYARSDLQRVLDAPHYGKRGVSWVAVRTIIGSERA